MCLVRQQIQLFVLTIPVLARSQSTQHIQTQRRRSTSLNEFNMRVLSNITDKALCPYYTEARQITNCITSVDKAQT